MYFYWLEQHTWGLVKEILIVKAPTHPLVYSIEALRNSFTKSPGSFTGFGSIQQSLTNTSS